MNIFKNKAFKKSFLIGQLYGAGVGALGAFVYYGI